MSVDLYKTPGAKTETRPGTPTNMADSSVRMPMIALLSTVLMALHMLGYFVVRLSLGGSDFDQIAEEVLSVLASLGVFAYIGWTYTYRPFRGAFFVGVIEHLATLTVVALWVGDPSIRSPTVLLKLLVGLCVLVPVGVMMGRFLARIFQR